MNANDTLVRQTMKGKQVLVTGHTGFKGSWLCLWLHEMGAKVAGVALDPLTDRNNYVLSGIGQKMETDIRADITKACTQLGWQPRTDIAQCCRLTADWYRRYRNEDVYRLCCHQIEEFTSFSCEPTS